MRMKMLKIGGKYYYRLKCQYCNSIFLGRRGEQRYCSNSCSNYACPRIKEQTGSANSSWKGGKYTTIGDRARAALKLAVKKGTIKEGDNCAICNAGWGGGYLVAHHQDYSKPLEVDWLCPSCHSKVHAIVVKLRAVTC